MPIVQNAVIHMNYIYCAIERAVGPSPFEIGLGAWGAEFGGSGATLPHVELPTENFAPLWRPIPRRIGSPKFNNDLQVSPVA